MKTKTSKWPLERVLFAMAGTMGLLSALLVAVVSPWFLILTALVGVNQWLYVMFGACRVHHQEKMITPIGNHQVIENSAVIIGEERIALSAGGETKNIGRHQSFQSLCRLGAMQENLTHMAYIEEPRSAAGMAVFGHDTHRVLHGHVPAREGHHSGAQSAVKPCKRKRFGR